MNELITLFLVALGLSMDACAVSISNSLCYKKFSRWQILYSSLAFGIFQGLMPTIGYFLGTFFLDIISKIDNWLALILLGFIGGEMIIDAIKEAKNKECIEVKEEKYGIKILMLQAVATSIDALAAGVSFTTSFPTINIITMFLVISLVTFACCYLGGMVGKKFGYLLKDKAKIFGGVILILIGIKIFFS